MPSAIVTGASSGIGKAIALQLAKEGYSLIINSRSNLTGLEETAALIEEQGGSCKLLPGDLADRSVCESLCSLTLQEYGSIDLLVNNAGIAYVGLFHEMPYEEIDRMISVNLMSVINLSHAVLPAMLHEHKGQIVNISSVWGQVGASCEVVYSASKGAVDSFTRALAKELAPSGIRVNAISCGAIDTPMNAWMTEEEHSMLIDEIPMGRMGKPEEAAELLAALAKGPEYLTGQIIRIDGGWI